MAFSSSRTLPGQSWRQQDFEHIGRQLGRVAAVFLAVAVEEEARQRRDVFAAIAQWRQMDRHDVEAVIQIVAETAGFDLIFQEPIGGGDDPGIDADGPAFADPFELGLLQDP